MNLAVIGDGGWGTALAILLNENGHEVTVWGPFEENISQTRATGENKAFLPGIAVPPQINWTTDRKQAIEQAHVIVMAVPTKFYASTLDSFKSVIPQESHLLSVSKGLDPVSKKRMTLINEEYFPAAISAALSGPSHAEEVARGIPTAVVMACNINNAAIHLQDIFASKRFRVYTSDDVTGVELGGALKNVIAIAVGISDGMGFGDNTRAALITRGLAEITRLGVALGAQKDTFSGLSGMGDLVVTCTSQHSRNRSVGERLGRGEKIDTIVSDMKQVAEGVTNCKTAREIAWEHKVEAPVIEQVYSIIYEGKDPAEAVDSLLSRDFKPEHTCFL